MMRARVTWWYGYVLLISAVTIAVTVVSLNPVAGLIAGGGAVLSATWTAEKWRADPSTVPDHLPDNDESRGHGSVS